MRRFVQLVDPRRLGPALWFLAISPIWLIGCGTLDTQSKSAAGVNFADYSSFTFAEAKHKSSLTPENEVAIQEAIASELQKRGLRRGTPADLQVCVYLKTEIKELDKANPAPDSGSLVSDLRTYYGLLYDNSWGTQSVVTYPEGTLVVHAVDTRSNRKVWEGVARGVLDRNPSNDKVAARIHEAVSGMFKEFPTSPMKSRG